MLTAERTALNFLQRLSGIATITRRFVDAAGGTITVLDTRKTTPTLRALEKYAVRAGGGTNHRAGLDDGVLIKDNHVRLAGGVAEAVKRMQDDDPEMPIEVEAQSLAQVDEAIAAGADIILVDNLPIDEIREAVKRINGRAKVELSGGVTLERIPELAQDRRELRLRRRADPLRARRGSELRTRADAPVSAPTRRSHAEVAKVQRPRSDY